MVVALSISAARYSGAATAPTRSNVSAADPFASDALEHEIAPVTLVGEVLLKVRGIPSYPAKERAQTISKRIEAIAADPSVASDSLRVVDQEDRTTIMAGDGFLMTFVDAHASLEGISRQLLAERAQIRIR